MGLVLNGERGQIFSKKNEIRDWNQKENRTAVCSSSCVQAEQSVSVPGVYLLCEFYVAHPSSEIPIAVCRAW